ncbi:ribose-phosphate diphosphokinase [Limobrevibacterium gyesilva]|uniref:ribose-phosphate diphosphokinase n=1 Tax=Limobrevibacterium gyesilva TaxID=2991712 RepID=A0AA42CH87_9PROT|nr:ribose-phosphate diphosphokinase [Limobrevibacterium gyesilva]MCW3474590.1 ribose-phosphate diphosphokinase [Limobrevibacterium gyesilva]
MDRSPLSFFGLQGSRELAERVARRLEIPLAAHEEREFEDGEHKARALHDVRGHHAFVLHSLHGDDQQSGNDKLCRLLFFCGSLKDSGAEHVTAVVPYLCYARKDRRTKPNDPIITRYVAAMFEAARIDRVIVMEVHNVAAFENAFRCPTRHIESAPLLARHFAPLLGPAQVVAVSPDAGGAKRAEQFRQALGQLTAREVGSAYMEKFRSSGVVSGELLAGDVRGKVAVIVDDLISTGGTLVRAAKACRAAGATRVFAAAAHGLFIDGAPELFAAGLDGIVVTDTVPPFRVPAEAAAHQLEVVDTSDMIARTIAACHDAG